MKMLQRSYIALPLMSLAFILAGCASGQYDKITEVDHETSMLRIHGNAQKGVTPERIAFADPWEHEEYAGLIGNGQRLEVFNIASANNQIALEYTYSLRRMIDT